MHIALVINMQTCCHTLSTRPCVCAVVAQETVHKSVRLELPFVVTDVASGETFAGTISFRRAISLDAKRAVR